MNLFFAKKIHLVFLIHIFSLYAKENQEIYAIGSFHSGLFSDLFGVINHLMQCEKQRKKPTIYWDHQSLYYVPEGYNGSRNVWEYYFEPLSKELICIDGSCLHTNYWTGFPEDITSGNKDLATRKKIHALLNNYVKIKSAIQEKIDRFFQATMIGKFTIGIHLRGTDKNLQIKPASIDKIIAHANSCVNNKTQFFIASEDKKLFEYAKKNLNGPVIAYDSFRINTDDLMAEKIDSWWQHLQNKALLGEEVLIESKLLSLCDKLICTHGSAVSTAALYFNPSLEYTIIT